MSGKGRLTGSLTSNGTSLLVWSDSRVDGNGVYGQRVNLDGTLGNPGASQVNGPSQFPQSAQLMQNYPNPFNPTTRIQFAVPVRSNVTLSIFNVLGQEVSTPVNEMKDAGTYEVTFGTANLSSGVYFYTLRGENFVQTKRMILAK